MKLLLVTTSYVNDNEGQAAAGTFVADFALALAREGHQVTVVTPATVASEHIANGVRVCRFAVPRLPLSVLSPARPQDWLPIIRTLLAGQRAVSHACENHGADHILALWALPCGQWARTAGRRFHTAYSTWALGSDIWTLGKLPVIRQLLARVLQHATLCYADGLQLGADVTAISGRACDFLPSSRQLESRSKTPRHAGPWRLAFLGRWHTNKGIDLLLDALLLLEEHDWQRIESIRIFGGGPLEPHVMKKTGQLMQQQRPIETGGYLDRQQATDLLLWADYLILPSRIESIPVIFSDAMQTRCPIIATPIGDLPALLHENPPCGILADATTPEAIADAIRAALLQQPADFEAGMTRMATRFDITQAARDFVSRLQQGA
ncbi:MAG TPA: glycosyltransferase family 4 protein [Pseudomonadales bacterium]